MRGARCIFPTPFPQALLDTESIAVFRLSCHTHTCFPSQLLGWPLQGLQDGPPLPPGSLHWLPHNGFSSLVSKILANFCSLEHSVSFLHEGIFSLIKLPRFWKVFEMGFLYVALDS